jgi:hypothetical protein
MTSAADGAAADLVLQGELVLAGKAFAPGETPGADQVGEVAGQLLPLAVHVHPAFVRVTPRSAP